MPNITDRVEFKCFKCGCCCSSINGIEELKGFCDRHGNCRYFDPDTRLCQIYDNRPTICNINEAYKDLSAQISWNDYVFTNTLNCVLLRYMQGVEEPKDSPFYGQQEQIANKMLRDRAAAKQQDS